jgi:hypothetical protein
MWPMARIYMCCNVYVHTLCTGHTVCPGHTVLVLSSDNFTLYWIQWYSVPDILVQCNRLNGPQYWMYWPCVVYVQLLCTGCTGPVHCLSGAV